MYCSNCGRENDNKSKFCKACGFQLDFGTLKVNSKEEIKEKCSGQVEVTRRVLHNKKLIYVVIGMLVCGSILLFVISNGKKNKEEVLQLKEPSAPICIESEEIRFLENQISDICTLTRNYDKEGKLLLKTKLDKSGEEIEKTEYFYEGGQLTKANIYISNQLWMEVYYEVDEEGKIQKEEGFFITKPGVIRIPEYIIFYSYDESGILVNKEISYTEYSARWEYYPNEELERYSVSDEDGMQPQYLKKYDALGNLIQYTEYDEAGNVLIAENYINEITYDSYNRQIYCETYREDMLVNTKKTTYYFDK